MIRPKQNTTGFTIVELLIVIVVIGILAAIVIVAYSGIQNRAYDTAVQSDLASMVKKIELEAVGSGSYQPASATTGIRVTKTAYDTAENNLYYCRNTTTNQYAIAARSKTKKDYKVVNGTISGHPTKLYGADTCTLVGAPSSAQLGWDANASAWVSWAQ